MLIKAKSASATTEASTPDDASMEGRWVTAVLDLITLTYQGKLTWKRTVDPAMWEEVFEAPLGDKQIRLEIPSKRDLPPSLYDVIGQRKPEQKPLSRSYPYLRIYALPVSSLGELLVSFPDIPPIGALTEAVRSQIAEGEDNVLREIHDFLTSE